MKKTSISAVAKNIIFTIVFICAVCIALLGNLHPYLLKILDCYLYRQYTELWPDTMQTIQSDVTYSVPWENDPAFLETKEKYGVIFMAAYKTVLIDPLPGEESNVKIAAEKLSGRLLMPGDIFSQNACLGPYTESEGYQMGPTYSGSKTITTIGGGVCKIASTLYNVAVLCDLPVIERHCHNMPVPYVPYGQDATVLYGILDFQFKNDTSSPILIWAQSIGNDLYIAFYGSQAPPHIEWHHQVLDIYKAKKAYLHNPELKNGEEHLLLEGMDGAVVQSWITIYNSDGTVSTKQMGISNYAPLPFLYEKKLY